MIIGITGRKSSGKDTAADFILHHPGYEDWARVKFADGLKTMLKSFLEYTGVDEKTIERMIEGDLKEVPCDQLCGKTPRFAMQTLGTEWGRQMIGDTIWVDATKDRCEQFDNCTITDVRFENEVDALHEMGGKLIKINRPNNPETDHHLSEAFFDHLKADYQIENDGKIVDMRDKVLEIVKEAIENDNRGQSH